MAAIERQVADGQELARQQADLLKIESGQLELQREQLADQRKASAGQAEVLELQAAELRESRQSAHGRPSRRAAGKPPAVLTEKPFKGRSGRSAAAYGEVIGGGPGPPSVTATAHNTSDQPIYDAEFLWHKGSACRGDPNPEPVGTLLPGARHSSTRDFPPGTNMEVGGAVLHFRDAAEVNWRRWPNGGLDEQP